MNGDRDRSSGGETHFGFRTVAEEKKADLVGQVFHSVAGKYDLMNDLMSFGAHRLWKKFATDQSGLRPGDRALDVAGGSGDLSRAFARQVGPSGTVVLTDVNPSMLAQGKQRLVEAGIVGNVAYALADAERLPFTDSSFDCVSISFGLRNVTHIDRALASMRRVVRPGGRLLVLEFSRPVSGALAKAYDFYSFNVIPRIGRAVTGDEESYQYLVESIRRFPDQQTLEEMMLEAGFDEVRYHNLSGGIVALHVGFRF